MEDEQKPEPIIKKRVPRKRRGMTDEEFDVLFALAAGAFSGLLYGMSHIERELQLLGKPHDKDKCLAAAMCPKHGKDLN